MSNNVGADKKASPAVTWAIRGFALLMFALAALFLSLTAMKVNDVKSIRETNKSLVPYNTQATTMYNVALEKEDAVEATFEAYIAKVEAGADASAELSQLGDAIVDLATLAGDQATEIGELIDATQAFVEETGIEIDYTESLLKLADAVNALETYVTGDFSSKANFNAFISDWADYRVELKSVTNDYLVQEEKTEGEHKTFLWLWLVCEVLSLLASSALMTMPDLEWIGGNEKFNRAIGIFLFALTAVQLILFIHFGIVPVKA